MNMYKSMQGLAKYVIGNMQGLARNIHEHV